MEPTTRYSLRGLGRAVAPLLFVCFCALLFISGPGCGCLPDDIPPLSPPAVCVWEFKVPCNAESTELTIQILDPPLFNGTTYDPLNDPQFTPLPSSYPTVGPFVTFTSLPNGRGAAYTLPAGLHPANGHWLTFQIRVPFNFMRPPKPITVECRCTDLVTPPWCNDPRSHPWTPVIWEGEFHFSQVNGVNQVVRNKITKGAPVLRTDHALGRETCAVPVDIFDNDVGGVITGPVEVVITTPSTPPDGWDANAWAAVNPNWWADMTDPYPPPPPPPVPPYISRGFFYVNLDAGHPDREPLVIEAWDRGDPISTDGQLIARMTFDFDYSHGACISPCPCTPTWTTAYFHPQLRPFNTSAAGSWEWAADLVNRNCRTGNSDGTSYCDP